MGRNLIPMLIVVLMGAHTALGAVASGHAFLEGETDHSGIKVELTTGIFPHLPSYTNSSGYFPGWVAISGGRYHTFKYTYPGYETQYLTEWIPLLGSVDLDEVTLPALEMSCEDLGWEELPYYPDGTSIEFTDDEGKHLPHTYYPVEWWYANFHLTGDSGKEYAAFVAFFKNPTMKLFSIADLDQEITYTDQELGGFLFAYEHWLDLRYCKLLGGIDGISTERSLDPSIRQAAGGLPTGSLPGATSSHQQIDASYTKDVAVGSYVCDRWFNKTQDGELLPYAYDLYVKGRDEALMLLDVDMQATKAPLIVGENGIIGDGADIWSYYYSHTRVDVEGTLKVHGTTEEVTGMAWIDHQWGGATLDLVTWDWFSIQLDNMTDIMVANAYVDGVPDPDFIGGLNYFDADCNHESLDDYAVVPTQFWLDEESLRVFGTQWHITESSKNIDLILTAEYENQMMPITPGYFFPLSFWEGTCSVTGTIDGVPVSGKAYAELTHSWE